MHVDTANRQISEELAKQLAGERRYVEVEAGSQLEAVERRRVDDPAAVRRVVGRAGGAPAPPRAVPSRAGPS